MSVQPAFGSSSTGQPSRRRVSQRRWSAQITALVMVLQAVFFLGIVAFYFSRVDWQAATTVAAVSLDQMAAGFTLVFLAPLGLAMAVAAVLALVRPRAAWVTAMIIQCIVLFFALQLYFGDQNELLLSRNALALILFGAIVIVVYLNAPEGRLLLARRAEPEPSTDAAEEPIPPLDEW